MKNKDPKTYYDHFVRVLGDHGQSAVLGSFHEQERMWNSPPEKMNIGHNQQL